MRSAEEAVAYLKALHAIVVYLGITDGNMEEGSFRCDANVSIRPKGAAEFGTRAELKNLNSFRHVQKAIEYEVSRQQDVLEDGDKVIQETRLFDSVKGVTMSMRDKEEAHDYRYFPDPDLVPVHITDEQLESWKASLPELPAQRRRRFMDEWKLPEQDADIITSDRAQADLFEAAVALYNEPRKIANYMTGPMLREINQTGVELKDSASSPKPLPNSPRSSTAASSAPRSRRIFSVNCTPTASCPKPTSVKKALCRCPTLPPSTPPSPK